MFRKSTVVKQVASTKLVPTKEQEQIVKAALEGKDLAIGAFAGSSKTTTSIMVAEALIKNSLYICFNKSIATEASEKFPPWVKCQTMHSLAYGEIVTPIFRRKIQNFFNMADLDPILKKILKVELDYDTTIKIKLSVTEVIKTFCQSDFMSLTDFIFEKHEELYKSFEHILPICMEYWKQLIDETNNIKVTHDVYLKMFQLSEPVLPYDVLYLDEAQDSNKVTLSIFLEQKKYGKQLIMVGDKYQGIYEWRGATNAMENLPSYFNSLYLTESFRFTQDIADIAGKVISLLGNDRKVIGRAKIESYRPAKATKAFLVRNNSTMFSILQEAYDNGDKVYVLADLNDLWGKLYHISALMGKNKPKYPNKELAQFKDFKDLLEASKSMIELQNLINITSRLSKGGLHSNIERIKSVVTDKVDSADFTVSTIHKSKGLEFDVVTIMDDLVPREYENGEEVYLTDKEIVEELLEGQEINLWYVALTRGKYVVNLPKRLEKVLDYIDWLNEEGKSEV